MKQFYTFLFSVSFLFLQAKEIDLSSPRAAVETHLHSLENPHYQPSVAAKVLFSKKTSKKEKEKRAIWLKQILDSKAQDLYSYKIPDNPNYTDPQSGNSIYVIDSSLSEIFLEKIGNKWYYSKKTVDAIPALYESTYPWGTKYLLKHFNSAQHNFTLFGLDLWKSIGFIILLIIGFFVYKLLVFILKTLGNLSYATQLRSKLSISDHLLMPIIKALVLFFVFYSLTKLIPVLQLPLSINKYLVPISSSLAPIFLTIACYYWVDILTSFLAKKAEATTSTLDDQLVPLIRKALKTFVIIIGGLFTLHNLGFNITAILAGISIGGLAIALAAQETLKNFFGSIMIFVDRPFQLGDWIIADKIDGSVEEVGFRSTRIRTFSDSVVSVPNGKLADMTINNFGQRKIRRYKTTLSATYSTSPELINQFTKGLKEIILAHPKTVKHRYHVSFTTFAASSLDVLFYTFFEVANWNEELEARHELNISIIKLADELGIDFAFPTQTIHIEKPTI